MATIKSFEIVCECCWMMINNCDESGCRDFWNHTKIDHPRQPGTFDAPAGAVVPACGSESARESEDCTMGENDQEHTYDGYLSDECYSCRGSIGYGSTYYHVAVFDE